MPSMNPSYGGVQTLDGNKSKVPAVTLGIWVIKILATTLGAAGATVALVGTAALVRRARKKRRSN